MKLSSYTHYSENDIYQKAIYEKWVGNGTSETPFIIESTHSLSDQSIIKSSSLHILIKNCTFKTIFLNRCKNLKFEGCSFEYVALSKCSRIILGNCSFKEKKSLDIVIIYVFRIHAYHFLSFPCVMKIILKDVQS